MKKMILSSLTEQEFGLYSRNIKNLILSEDRFSGYVEGAGTFTCVHEDFVKSFLSSFTDGFFIVLYDATTGQFNRVTFESDNDITEVAHS